MVRNQKNNVHNIGNGRLWKNYIYTGNATMQLGTYISRLFLLNIQCLTFLGHSCMQQRTNFRAKLTHFPVTRTFLQDKKKQQKQTKI